LRRSAQNVAAKLAIAREASGLVQDGDSILLDSSSTVFFLARVLAGRNRLRIMTNGFEVARELAQNPSNTVILIGGVVNNDSSSVTGLLSEQIIAEMHIEKAFFSCSGFSIERGMTDVHFEEAQLKRKAVESARRLYALIDSSKLGKEDMTSFARSEKISHLFTDAAITDDWKTRLHSANIPFVVCAEDTV
jgi:DeoR/GlpR family transcriptional regulator of sugar metabolism